MLQDSWKGCEYRDGKETKWRYDRDEKAARIVGRARDCVHRSLAKAMLPLAELNFGVIVSFVCLVFGESVRCLHKSGPEVN